MPHHEMAHEGMAHEGMAHEGMAREGMARDETPHEETPHEGRAHDETLRKGMTQAHGARGDAKGSAKGSAKAPAKDPTKGPAKAASEAGVASSGLEGVVVAHTRLSGVDGERGRLILRGRSVEELAPAATFEEACALFLDVDTAEARRRLGEARARARPWSEDFAVATDAMEALRIALAQPGSEDPWEAIGLIAVALASFAGRGPVDADPAASHAHDLLRMWRGAGRGEPDAALVRALDTYLVTVIDHGMNASTFAARVVASTGSDLRSCLVAGVGALKGPLHGGAPGPVLDMLDAVSEPARAAAWLEGELDAGRRIMGMGHRIYRVRDPRAAVLERAVEKLPATPRLALARAVEKAAEEALARRHPERPLKANVEFFTAVLLDAVGIDRRLFSGVFACARVAGWCAHVGEQRRVGRLIRPASIYVD